MNRPSREDRLDWINDRLTNRVPSDLPARDRWENRWWNHYHYHQHWFHGHWNNHYWEPGSRWNYWWDNYPVLSTFGLTTWAINRVGWAFGYYDYRNPYYVASSPTVVYDYSQPIVMAPTEQTLAGDPADTTIVAPPPEALSDFDQARQFFYAGQYDQALAQVDAAIQKMPNDAVLHEFRALTLFALGRYQEAAATLYPVLSVGPGWDWTTMIGLYPNVDEYTKHLRALEAYRKSHTDDPSPRFLLAYHYLTAGHTDAAQSQLQNLLQMTPDDPLAKRLLLELDPDAEVPSPPEQTLPPEPTAKIDAAQLVGSWTAQRDNGQFTMTLSENRNFDWKYTEGGQSQEVTGVWSVDEQGVLAMQMNDGGTMLAQLNFTAPGKLDFYMIGDTQGSEPLHFTK